MYKYKYIYIFKYILIYIFKYINLLITPNYILSRKGKNS